MQRQIWTRWISSRVKKIDPLPNQPENASKKAQEGRTGLLENLDIYRDEPQSARRVVIDAIGEESFTINGLYVRGAVMLFPFFTTLWNVSSTRDLNENAFVLPKLFQPKPDIIILGMGRTMKPLSANLSRHLYDMDINVEVLNTTNACQTYNVLNLEGRNVVAALLPSTAD